MSLCGSSLKTAKDVQEILLSIKSCKLCGKALVGQLVGESDRYCRLCNSGK